VREVNRVLEWQQVVRFVGSCCYKIRSLEWQGTLCKKLSHRFAAGC